MAEEDPRRYIFPFLPAEANEKIADWQTKGRRVFARGNQTMPEVKCQNCQDHGFVYVTFAYAGPFATPPKTGGKKVLMWFDGGPDAGKGWYVAKTETFPCPNCVGRKEKRQEAVDEEEVQTAYWDD